VICIFSSSVDYSTTDVIRWLHHLGKKDVIRVNYHDLNNNNQVRIDITEGSFSFALNGSRYQLQDIEAVWYRKGKNWLCDQFYPVTIEGHCVFSDYLNYKFKCEESTLSEYLHFIIETSVPVLGTSIKGDLNKLLVLKAAKECGLMTPAFYVTNHTGGIQQAFNLSSGLITKSMSDGLYLFENKVNNTGYFSYTEKVDKEMTQHLPESFSPSFLQENILKKYELRVFYLDGKCYSMAILSQSDEQTKTDFRKYNEKKPNRFVPFKLPATVERNVIRLFRKLELNTGSADLLVDLQDQYYFLEINPVGQFGMVSSPCNYYLEKQVALKLLENEKNYQPGQIK
jgi:ATP-GRASP peptide maturase of grasp-with-spasm system